MNARLGGRIGKRLEGPKLRKHTQGSTRQLEPNDLVNNIRCKVVKRKTLLSYDFIKESDIERLNPVSQMDTGTPTFPADD